MSLGFSNGLTRRYISTRYCEPQLTVSAFAVILIFLNDLCCVHECLNRGDMNISLYNVNVKYVISL